MNFAPRWSYRRSKFPGWSQSCPLRQSLSWKTGIPVEALKSFLGKLLEKDVVSALLVSEHLPMNKAVMPALVTDAEKLDGADPLAPAFPLNAARLLSRLSRKPSGIQMAAVMRPCEIRAFFELVKLKQGSAEDLLLIGMDCLGTFGNNDYACFAGSCGDSSTTLRFYQKTLGTNNEPWNGPGNFSCVQVLRIPGPEWRGYHYRNPGKRYLGVIFADREYGKRGKSPEETATPGKRRYGPEGTSHNQAYRRTHRIPRPDV